MTDLYQFDIVNPIVNPIVTPTRIIYDIKTFKKSFEGIYDGMPAYKSGGQVDGGIPIAEKFSAEVAAATSAFAAPPTPQWSYLCDKNDASSTMCKNVQASFNTMRTFKENGVEKLAVTFRMPKEKLFIFAWALANQCSDA